ncbi:MAG: ferredoxin reductase, partial [Aeromicrobium sp.]
MAAPLIERSGLLRRVRTAGKAFTTPLAPDDYLALINPLWSARQLRGRIERVDQETDRAATLVIRPGWGWRFDHHPGQYIGIGVEVEGKYHWRSYSLSSEPLRDGRTISITVKAMPEGFLSEHLVSGLEPGTIVRLEAPQGEFILPDPPPDRMLFLVGGSGITPVMSMLRTMSRRGTMPDVVLAYSAVNEDDMMFADELRELAASEKSLRLYERFTDADGFLTPDQL